MSGPRILVVCVGNRCRSPLAERLLQARLDAGRPGWAQVRSAGTQAQSGQPVEPTARGELLRLGGDATGFTSRPLAAVDGLDEVDLVLTMTRDLRTQVLRAAPRLVRRTFTLAELAALTGGRVIGTARVADVRALAGAAATVRTRAAGAPDVDDPVGRGPTVHRRVAQEISDLLDQVVPTLLSVGRDAQTFDATAVRR